MYLKIQNLFLNVDIYKVAFDWSKYSNGYVSTVAKTTFTACVRNNFQWPNFFFRRLLLLLNSVRSSNFFPKFTGDNSFGQFGDGTNVSRVNFTDTCGQCSSTFKYGWYGSLQFNGETCLATGRNDVKKKKKKFWNKNTGWWIRNWKYCFFEELCGFKQFL